MAYPPPNPGYPGYPPPSGLVGGYPPQQSSPWAPGGGPAPYPSQPPSMPTPGGGGQLGFGSAPAPRYPSQGVGPSYPPFPSFQPPPSTYPPPPSSTYPPPPSTTYPPGPPAPSQYPSGLPPAPFTSPPQGGGYPSSAGGFTPQPIPSVAGFTPQPTPGGYPQPTLGGYSQYSTPQAPPGGYPSQPPSGGYPSQPPPLQPPPTDQMAAMSVSSQQKTTSSTKSPPPSSSSSSSSVTASKQVPMRGTVKPHSPFSAEDDARKLRTAMKGLGTDEKAIISVLAYRSSDQRQEIKIKFKSMFGRDLISDVKSELSGHLEEVVLGLMMTPQEYDAAAVYNAIKGLGTDESTLIEILCTRSNEEIIALKKQYKSAYGKDVEKDVASDTSGHFKRVLISLLTGARERDGSVNPERARTDAQALYRAGEARWGTDESVFNQVLASRSFSHLRVVFQEYSKICKYDIEQSISREMSGDLKNCMITVVKCVRDKSGYFAERLYRSMKGLGTDDRTLVRVMVTRCEVDMEDIKDKFYQKYRKHLGSFIKGDTSGDYRRILMALARADD